MHQIFRIRFVFMCIFALTHHLPTISASASDLLSSTISSSLLLSSLALQSSSATASRTSKAGIDTVTAKSSAALTETRDLSAIENNVAAKEISIASSSAAIATTASNVKHHHMSPSASYQPLQQRKMLPIRRQKRYILYPYPYSYWYSNNNPYFPYFYPNYNFYRYWGIYNPYYGYPPVACGG